MTQCNVPQAIRNSSQAPSKNHKEPRANADKYFSNAEGAGDRGNILTLKL